MPVRDDWASASELLRRLGKAISSYASVVDIFLVDDGSLQKYDRDSFQSHFPAVRTIRILRLRRNLGHQRAIAIGLAHIQKNAGCNAVLVMDSDGEDTPRRNGRTPACLLGDSGQRPFLQNGPGGQNLLCFDVSITSTGFCTSPYRHQCTGGKLQHSALRIPYTLVAMPEMWNHYAAAVFRSGLPFTMIPISRGKRIAGTSKMNFTALVSHGLSAISVFGDIVGVRLLIGSAAGSLLAVLGLL